ncbi:stalk domain-containing protein [Paenibacillus sp. GYB003]|uniref:stalk domain-containing protein n=1 Tax=Paenibacillus sp. GYB003 TaxID=2994392 RepID=UPI002F96D101
MKKSWIAAMGAVVAVLVFVTGVSAADGIRVWVNGRLLESPEAAPRLENGKVIAPVREMAESLGAKVEWDGERGAVRVTAPESESLQRQIRLLQSALAAKTPEAAVDTWAKAVQTRNGALQYAMLSERQRELQRESLEADGWVTGTSSPWLERYRISKAESNGDGSKTFRVQFDYRSSTDIREPERWDKIASFPVIVREEDGYWRISSFPTEWAYQSVVLPNGLPFSEYDGIYEGADVRAQFQRLGVAAAAGAKEAVGNHAEIVRQEPAELPVGKAIFMEVKRTPPAAAMSDAVTTELWFVLLRDDPERPDLKRAYCLTGVVTGDGDKAYDELKRLAATWKLIEN